MGGSVGVLEREQRVPLQEIVLLTDFNPIRPNNDSGLQITLLADISDLEKYFVSPLFLGTPQIGILYADTKNDLLYFDAWQNMYQKVSIFSAPLSRLNEFMTDDLKPGRNLMIPNFSGPVVYHSVVSHERRMMWQQDKTAYGLLQKNFEI